MNYIILITASYIITFIIYTIIKLLLPEEHKKIIFCTVCYSAFTTLIITLLIPTTPAYIIGLLLGASITGISYKIDQILTENKKEYAGQLLIIQTTLIIIGILLLQKL